MSLHLTSDSEPHCWPLVALTPFLVTVLSHLGRKLI